MHELSIAATLLEQLEANAASNNIARFVEIHLAVGEMTCIEPEQLTFCIGSISKGSVAEDALVTIERVKAVIECPSCSYAGEPKYWDGILADGARIATLECPACGGSANATAGQDCRITSVRCIKNTDPVQPKQELTTA